MTNTSAKYFFFYDLETSGFNPNQDRIMQFAGQRTDLDLNPVGDPHNYLIKLSEDVLPNPQAILVTGITPQQTLEAGITEAEFLRIFAKDIALPNTVFTGFNSVRFDDEFTRRIHFRNFFDPYEWAWKDGRSRWDILDLARMARALRPGGIKWPVGDDGKPLNRLAPLAEINEISHENAHDALSDVVATIGLARLLKLRQPKLFNYLFDIRDKARVAQIIESGDPYVYTSGKYEDKFEKTTVVGTLAKHPTDQAALVFDLRYNPKVYEEMSPRELVELWAWRPDDKDNPSDRLPVKTIKYNRCPAIAPLSVLDESSIARLNLDMVKIKKHFDILVKSGLSSKILDALEIMEGKREIKNKDTRRDVDDSMYDNFIGGRDKDLCARVRQAPDNKLKELEFKFSDWRLNTLLPLYKARNFPDSLTAAEKEFWDKYRKEKIHGSDEKADKLTEYMAQLDDLLKDKTKTPRDKLILAELLQYSRSIG